MRSKGKLKSWNAEKAFGFIQPMTKSDKDIFIHKSAFQNRTRTPKVGEVITYNLTSDTQNRKCAANATFSGERLRVKDQRDKNKFSLLLPLLFILFLLYAYLEKQINENVLIFYVLVNTVTFFTYWVDKSKARTNSWRISENTLHGLSLFGGWLGAALAQEFLRHKSKKTSFRVAYWFTVISHLSIVFYVGVSSPDILINLF